ncbi:hypothetical protein [Azotobacter beijerinckii]|uniref:hypothetical protein n=1 Tax=Azotobacter beijerinckii TaxID=170623 RepID=UPI002955BE07|nr:hypothetical protein [Azotobacter beijerinckii]MDV7213996.1 hypothetical protein [Azotobacter beijerinckii]
MDTTITQLDDGSGGFPALFDPDVMKSLDGNLAHLVGNRLFAVAGQAVDTGPDKEMGTGRACRTEEFIDMPVAR